jgi:hypothetical protein
MFADWTKLQHREKFFNHLMSLVGCDTLEDFYRISPEDIAQYGGKVLLERVYDGHLTTALQSIYPNHTWLPWKFEQRVPHGFWEKLDNQTFFMDWLTRKLNYTKMNDLYKMTSSDIVDNGGSRLIGLYGGSVSKMLQTVYSQHKWTLEKFRKSTKKHPK